MECISHALIILQCVTNARSSTLLSNLPMSSSHILLIGGNSVQSLVPSSLISQVESLLDGHRLEDAFNLADARRKKLEESLEVDEDEVCSITVP